MIKACDALVARKPNFKVNYTENQILKLITQQRCKSLCNYGLFKYSVFLAPVTLLVILPF